LEPAQPPEPPEAVQEVAPVEDQVKVEVPLEGTEVGDALSDTEGGVQAPAWETVKEELPVPVVAEVLLFVAVTLKEYVPLAKGQVLKTFEAEKVLEVTATEGGVQLEVPLP
jgi:hypothetical protein